MPVLTWEQQLHDQARKCRALAASAMTGEGRSILLLIAQRYEREAAANGPLEPSEQPEFAA